MRLFLVLSWGLMAAGAAIPAAAAPFNSGPELRPYVQYPPPWYGPRRDGSGANIRPYLQNQPPWYGPPRNANGPPPQRDMRAPGEPERGRMSPDERRQLRRDIQDAGREIYYRRDVQPPRRDLQAPRRDQQPAQRSGRR
jgi:hypothetical protein